MRHPWGVSVSPRPGALPGVERGPGGAVDRPGRRDTRLDRYVNRYAARTHGMTASAIRALFSVANRPEVVSLAGGMPNIADLPLDVVGSSLPELVTAPEVASRGGEIPNIPPPPLDVVGSSLHELVTARGMQAMQSGSGRGEPMIR